MFCCELLHSYFLHWIKSCLRIIKSRTNTVGSLTKTSPAHKNKTQPFEMEPPLYLQMFIIGRKEPNPNNKYLVKLGKCCKVVCLGERALKSRRKSEAAANR